MNLYFNGPNSAFLANSALVASFGVTDLGSSFGPIVPSYASSLNNTSRILSLQFGDGYRQRSPDGINNVMMTMQMVFQNRKASVIKELVKFFRGEGLYAPTLSSGRTPDEWFYFIPPEPFDYLSVRRFTCDEWPVKWASSSVGTLTATFVETFAVATTANGSLPIPPMITTSPYEGTQAIAYGATQVVISGLGLQWTPKGVICQVMSPVAEEGIESWVIPATLSTSGFTAQLGSTADSANYVLSFIIF
jgi:phage-related protein